MGSRFRWRWNRQSIAVTVAAALTWSCGFGEDLDQLPPPEEEIIHPIESELLSSSGEVPVRTVTLQAAPVDPPPDVRSIRSFEDHSRWGSLSEPVEEVMGRLVDGTVLSDGRIVVVDRNYGVVRLFDRALTSSQVLGSSGDGPGEFVNPIGVTEDAEGGLVVANHLGSVVRLERFVTDADSFAFARRLQLPLVSDDGARACGVADRMLVSGLVTLEDKGSHDINFPFLQTLSFVHTVDEGGVIVESLLPPYRGLIAREDAESRAQLGESQVYRIASDVEIALYFSTARLACSDIDGRPRAWVGYSVLGEVHATHLDGSVEWIARLEDLETLVLSQQVHEFGTSVGAGPDSSGPPDLIESVVHVPPSLLAVSVRLGEPETNGSSYRNYLIDSETGELRDAFESPHMILAAGDGLVVLYREDPFPEIAAVELAP